MTPDEKQAALKRWLPEIAKACYQGKDIIVSDETGDVWVNVDNGHIKFSPQSESTHKAFVCTSLGIIVSTGPASSTAFWPISGLYADTFDHVEVLPDGTPEGKGEAERWAVLQAAAKKLGLE